MTHFTPTLKQHDIIFFSLWLSDNVSLPSARKLHDVKSGADTAEIEVCLFKILFGGSFRWSLVSAQKANIKK